MFRFIVLRPGLFGQFEGMKNRAVVQRVHVPNKNQVLGFKVFIDYGTGLG